MGRRIKKLVLASVALALMVGNTDYAIGLIVVFVPGAFSPFRIFVMFALIANLEAIIWYKLGKPLVEVLGGCYSSILRWTRKPGTSKLTIWFLSWGISMLRPFYEWEETKKKIRTLLENLSRSPKYVILAVGSWLMLPGSRSVTAVLFGMEEWPGAMVALLVINTLHVGLSFGFWATLISCFRYVVGFFAR